MGIGFGKLGFCEKFSRLNGFWEWELKKFWGRCGGGSGMNLGKKGVLVMWWVVGWNGFGGLGGKSRENPAYLRKFCSSMQASKASFKVFGCLALAFPPIGSFKPARKTCSALSV